MSVVNTESRAAASAATEAAAPTIRANNLRKAFGPIVAVDDVSFELPPGRIYGFLGPNGSGKTTLIRLLTGLGRSDGGSAEVLGARMPSRTTLARIGYMTQSDGIYLTLTAGENVRFFGTVYGRPEPAAARAALELVELADRTDTIAATLSGGQRRRLSLACALVHEPAVLFLDEPTVGVDPLLRVEFWAHSWTRPTAATSCCSCAPAGSSPAAAAPPSARRRARRISRPRSCGSPATAGPTGEPAPHRRPVPAGHRRDPS